MLAAISVFFADKIKRFLPDPFVFAIGLTLLMGILSMIWVGATPQKIIQSWYQGFWILLQFGMQIVLLLVTGYAIALSPLATKMIDWLASKIKTPVMVYGSVVFIGGILTLISWAWFVLTAVLARELSKRLKNIDYPYLIACTYLSGVPWVCGLSSSIPLLLNTENNFLIKTGVLTSIIPISSTLGSMMNIFFLGVWLIIASPLMILLRPSGDKVLKIEDLQEDSYQARTISVWEEAKAMRLCGRAVSDQLNNSVLLQLFISIMGLWYIGWHFFTHGFDLNLNIMIFIFIITGMIVHVTPMRYVIAMKRASGNISGIVFQYPFYAGIMGIIIYTGLGQAMSAWMSHAATIKTFPFIAFLTGGLVHFAIPSAGGEWAVVGPSIIETAKVLMIGMSQEQITSFIARLSLATAYGEALFNLLQPFFILIILPVMGAGLRIQARDVMGYLVIPVICFTAIDAVIVTWVPL